MAAVAAAALDGDTVLEIGSTSCVELAAVLLKHDDIYTHSFG